MADQRPKIPGGFYLIARKTIEESGIMDKPPLYFKLWVWMLGKAFHSHGQKLSRGEFLTSYTKIATAMGYESGNRTEKPSKRQLEWAVKWFRDQGMIEVKKIYEGMRIWVKNFEFYQDPANYETLKKTSPEPGCATGCATGCAILDPSSIPANTGLTRPSSTPGCAAGCATGCANQGFDENQGQNSSQKRENFAQNEANQIVRFSNDGPSEAMCHTYGKQLPLQPSSLRPETISKSSLQEPFAIAENREGYVPTIREECKSKNKSKEKNLVEKSFPTFSDTVETHLTAFQENQNIEVLVRTALQKLHYTRKAGKIADSVLVTFLGRLRQYENWKIGTGIIRYLEGEYWLDQKSERYLEGIIRNVTPRDYEAVISGFTGKNQSTEQVHCPQPRTYAQYQDAEDRALMQRLRQLEAEEGQDGDQAED